MDLFRKKFRTFQKWLLLSPSHSVIQMKQNDCKWKELKKTRMRWKRMCLQWKGRKRSTKRRSNSSNSKNYGHQTIDGWILHSHQHITMSSLLLCTIKETKHIHIHIHILRIYVFDKRKNKRNREGKQHLISSVVYTLFFCVCVRLIMWAIHCVETRQKHFHP